MAASPRWVTPVSDAELERRRGAVREAMVAEGLAALVVENNNNSVGGYVQWFTGVPAVDGMPLAVVLPADDEMTVVCNGLEGMRREAGPDGDPIFRGAKVVLSTANFPAVRYTATYQASLLEEALCPYAGRRVGLCNPSQMLSTTVDHLRAAFASTTFVDAAELVDPIKVVKSAEEIGLVRRAAALQDEAMRAALAAIEPGRTEREVAVVANNLSRELGADQGFVLIAAAPPGTPTVFVHSHLQGRVIEAGDVVNILVENSGPGGMWSEIGRTAVLGRPTGAMVEDFELALAAQAFTMSLLRPGRPAAEVWDAYAQYLREHDKPPERRIHCHGQGYDLVERPLVRHDETLVLADSLNVACHPNFLGVDAFCSLTDGFVVTGGVSERLHKTPQQIFEL